jgi:hypothetical protein
MLTFFLFAGMGTFYCVRLSRKINYWVRVQEKISQSH